MSPAQAGQVKPALSVLIPALNEAQALPALLDDLTKQQGLPLEVVVADGGSRDATAAVCQAHGVACLHAPRGRGAQLNAAVAASKAPWLVCLHADSHLTSPTQLADGLSALQAQTDRSAVAGHWPLRFVRAQPGYEGMFRQLEAKSASNRPGTVNGDQGLLLHRSTLTALGGFDESLPFFEDHRMAAKVFAHGRFLLLPGVIETSARRFEIEGHGPRMVVMALMVGAEAAGLQDWLAGLPALYREQAAATQLAHRPFIESLLSHIASLPSARQQQVWRAAGVLVAANAWQLAHWLDAERRSEPRWLRRFDAVLAPFFAGRVATRSLALALPMALRLLARWPLWPGR